VNKNNKTSEQTEQTTINSSLRFGLLGAALTTLGDAIVAIAALEAIDESITADIQAKKDQQELNSGSNFPFVFNHFNHFFNYIYKVQKYP
jgi:hypothetical protein